MSPTRRWIAAWEQHWFRPGSLLDLAMARIVLAAILLYLNGGMRFLTVGLAPPELWEPLPWIAALGIEQPTVKELLVVGRLNRWTLVAALLGFLTPVALSLAFVLQLFQEGLLNCFGKVSHGTIPLLYALLCFALAPCARTLSIDALLRRAWQSSRGRPPEPSATSAFATWPFELILVELTAYYFLAGFAKVRASGLAWADGHTLQYYLLEKATPAGLWLAEHLWLCALVSALVLAFELAAPLAVVWRRFRPLFFLGGISFHLGTTVFLNIQFWPVYALYALFIPWSRLRSRLLDGSGRAA